MKFELLNLEPENYSPSARSRLATVANVYEQSMDRQTLLSEICNYDALVVRLGHQINKEILLKARRLKVIISATTGLNHIDLEQAQEQGVSVLSLRGETKFLKTICATAEHTMALILASLRNLPAASQHVKSGSWDRDLFKGAEIAGKTIGILGYGRLGAKVGHYSHAFGAKVIANDLVDFEKEPFVEKVPYEQLLQQSDILSVHLPYNKATYKYIGSEAFSLIKTDAILINTARGEVLCEHALLHALKSKKLSAAALDVLQGEYSGDSNWMTKDPLINYARNNDNLLITPHIGGATKESMERTELFMANKFIEHVGSL